MEKLTFTEYFKERCKHGKAFMAVLLLFILFQAGSFVYFLVLGRPRDYLLSVGFLAFVPVFFGAEYFLRIRFSAFFTAFLLFLASGCILGASYDWYSYLPSFDTVLHTMSGFAYACLAFAGVQWLLGKPQNTKQFVVYLLFGLAFSLAIEVVWELFEYASTALIGFDMQEDTIIHGFGSYFLSGTHTELVEIEGITKTIIYYGDGLMRTIDGYLDIGLIDTILDMAVCFLGTLVYLVVLLIDWFKGKALYRVLIPAKAEAAELSEEPLA